MDLIPVIDLMDGLVVHAKRGDRVNYRPIQSQLCASSAPHEIINSLLELYPFKRLYIADINAIQGRGDHAEVVNTIKRHYPMIEIWLDAAIDNPDSAKAWQQQGVVCVIGSESISAMNDYCDIRKLLKNRFVLSLDFNQAGFLGPDVLLQDNTLWPERLIAMTLDRVGSAAGPDMEKLYMLRSRHPQIYAAGGIRSFADMMALAPAGIAGALIASILHSGSISTSQIESIIHTQPMLRP